MKANNSLTQVASHETPLKSEPHPGFSYNFSNSHMNQARSLKAVPTTQSIAAAHADGMPSYMQNHVDPSSYRDSHGCGSSMNPLPWDSTYCDAVADQHDSAYQPHSIYPTYQPREPPCAPQYQHPPAKALATYMDAEIGAYGIASSPNSATELAHRTFPSVADVASGSWCHACLARLRGTRLLRCPQSTA